MDITPNSPDYIKLWDLLDSICRKRLNYTKYIYIKIGSATYMTNNISFKAISNLSMSDLYSVGVILSIANTTNGSRDNRIRQLTVLSKSELGKNLRCLTTTYTL